MEFWTVDDKEYSSNHEFVDEYIRNGHLLVYSNCNKLYKQKIIKDNNISINEHKNDTLFFSAFGLIVSLDNWYKSESGRNVVFHEVYKSISNDYDIYLKFINP